MNSIIMTVQIMEEVIPPQNRSAIYNGNVYMKMDKVLQVFHICTFIHVPVLPGNL